MGEIKLDSEWYLISTQWVKQWQLHTYFDCIDNEISEKVRDSPGPINCADLVEPHSSNVLMEPSLAPHLTKWMDMQIKIGK